MMTNNLVKQSGFTIIELMIVMIVMSLFAAPFAYQHIMKFEEDRIEIAVAEINDLFQSAQNYAAEQDSEWPSEADNCASAITTLNAENYLQGFSLRTPFGTNLSTSCTTGDGKRFMVSIDAVSAGNAEVLNSYLPSSTVSGNLVTVSVPMPAAIPALDHLLPRDGSRPMTGDLDMGGNRLLEVENIEFPDMDTTSAEAIYFAGIVGNNELVQKNQCPDGLTPTPIVVPVGYSDNGTANPVGAVYAWAENVNANQWRARLRLNVQRNGNWVAMQPSSTHGLLAVYLKCS
ncbi:pilus assembly FimT family protein [Methylophaga pinxianii]|uniref:pilus assembly FimT family protein n=1 Tax=Methylophaga pinxianii TaxID=2881052 RepID=UPI001CF53AEE|nr:type II secretion system protein [Methylophaga pinxianii]MCB2425753.1 type II secretion system GspH family protein [Methylophaga pinxianii]UPH47305.1 type II secretion system GspH family protein [Methylophaga pinxianii]